MLSPDLESAMNTQIATELYSSHLYLAMSAYSEAEGLPGFATWFRMQSDEERGHALKFMRHVVDRGGRAMLTGMNAPAMDFGSPQGAFEQALAHEMDVTMMIDGLYGMAMQHGDYASQVFLQWFVTEQVEEERTATQIVQTLKNLGNDPASVLILDRELGARQAAG
jgi:ferritin